MQMKMRDALGVGWDDPELDAVIEVCGATKGIYVCDEPYWMGEHRWHISLASGWQWCECGDVHAWNAECSGASTPDSLTQQLVPPVEEVRP